MLNGVFVYETEAENLTVREDVHLDKLTIDPETWHSYNEPEKVELLIARQGLVNDMLDVFPNIKWLQLLNAGFERVDLDKLKKRNIVFTNARSVYCNTIGEDVIAKILILARNYMTHFEDQKHHFWPTDDQLPNTNIDIAGKTLAILGAGFIGKSIARLAKVFGMRVEGYDPYILEQEGFDLIGHDMKEILNRADFVVTSLPVTQETKSIVNKEMLSMMKPTAFLINVARGEIVDEEALVWALNTGIIQGAAIDVTCVEPLPDDSPLWTAKNILITPHRAAYGDKMKTRMCGEIKENISRYLNGEALIDQVRI